MGLQQTVLVYSAGAYGRHSRDGLERALDIHTRDGRIVRWGRQPDGGNGHVISMTNGEPVTTRSLRETAIAVLMLASAAEGARKRARLAAQRNPED